MESLSSRISKRDFPLVKRGYEPDAVDEYIVSIGRSVAGLEEELTVAKAKAEKLETRLRSKSDADTVVQTAFLAAAEAKSKLLQEAEQRASQIIAAAEARATEIQGTRSIGSASPDAINDLDAARTRAQQIEADAIRLLEEARREAEAIVTEARRIAESVPPDAALVVEETDEAREELHRLVWLLKTVKQAVATGIGAAEASTPELALVLEDAADLAELRPVEQ